MCKSSGDVGYCAYTQQMRGIIINWNGNTVESVECDHATCGYADKCDLYQRRPIGFAQTYPAKDTSIQ